MLELTIEFFDALLEYADTGKLTATIHQSQQFFIRPYREPLSIKCRSIGIHVLIRIFLGAEPTDGIDPVDRTAFVDE